MNNRIILGIDPGTNIMGYGIISIQGSKISLVVTDVLKLGKTDDPFEKLGTIYRFVEELIKQHDVSELAIEAPFYGKNVQSMLKLGRAQGVCIAAGIANKIPVTEYSPRKVKMSITGKGSSSKEQVAAMIERLVPAASTPQYLDATDALAVAICHSFQFSATTPEKSAGKKAAGSWKNFISQNPGRIKK